MTSSAVAVPPTNTSSVAGFEASTNALRVATRASRSSPRGPERTSISRSERSEPAPVGREDADRAAVGAGRQRRLGGTGPDRTRGGDAVVARAAAAEEHDRRRAPGALAGDAHDAAGPRGREAEAGGPAGHRVDGGPPGRRRRHAGGWRGRGGGGRRFRRGGAMGGGGTSTGRGGKHQEAHHERGARARAEPKGPEGAWRRGPKGTVGNRCIRARAGAGVRAGRSAVTAHAAATGRADARWWGSTGRLSAYGVS